MDQTRQINEISPGCYQMRLVRGGPFVPVLLERIGDQLVITLNGVRQSETFSAHPDDVADRIGANLAMGTANRDPLVRFHWAEKITKEHYDRLIMVLGLLRKHQPDHPMMTPTKPVNLSKVRPIW